MILGVTIFIGTICVIISLEILVIGLMPMDMWENIYNLMVKHIEKYKHDKKN